MAATLCIYRQMSGLSLASSPTALPPLLGGSMGSAIAGVNSQSENSVYELFYAEEYTLSGDMCCMMLTLIFMWAASSKVKSDQPICELVEVDSDAYDSSDCFDSHEESHDTSIQ